MVTTSSTLSSLNQIGSTECQQIPIGGDSIAMAYRKIADGAIGFCIQNQEHGNAQLADAQILDIGLR